MPANAPSAPVVIARRSWSLPTQAMTKSRPSAAACGVGAVWPPNFSAQAFALAGVRLNTVTSCPPLVTRCPAMGKPITPRPRKATLAMFLTLGFLPAGLNGPGGMLEDGTELVSVLETGPSQAAEAATID